jgi:hypothetical protein
VYQTPLVLWLLVATDINNVVVLVVVVVDIIV